MSSNSPFHSIGGAAPYRELGHLDPGRSVMRPHPITGQQPDADDPAWSRPYPIIPCGGISWGIDDRFIHFSPVLHAGSKPEAGVLAYGIMTWVFYAATSAIIFSVERTINPAVPWLNVITHGAADWRALDILHERLVKAADVRAEVQALCNKVRP